MALTFPQNPVNNQIYEQYIFDSVSGTWKVYDNESGLLDVLATKANLSGGNTFSGNQVFNNYLSHPGHPSFQAQKTTHTTASSYLVFDSVWHNIGNAYNVSNGRFTAPISGRYLINFSTLLYTMGSSSNVYIYINGLVQQFLGTYGQFTGSYAGQGGTAVVNLNANDYLQLYFAFAGTNLHSSYTSASGYFLG